VFAPLELKCFAIGCICQLQRCNVERAHDLLVDDANATGGNGSHGKLRLSWGAELANDEDVEGGAEGLRDLVRHRNAAARKGEDDDLVAGALLIDERAEVCSKLPPGVDSIGKHRGFSPASEIAS
jgi:hypothetical protein